MTFFEFVRQYRIAGYALFDLGLSLLAAGLLSPLLSKGCEKIGLRVPRLSWIYAVLPVSVAAHLLFHASTPFTEQVVDPHGHFLQKTIVLVLFILAVKDIRTIPAKRKKRD